MILVLLAILCLASVPLTGGSLGRLAELRLRRLWITPAALLLQVVITEIVPGYSHALLAALHIVSYCLIVGFLWSNRGIPGARVITAGTLSNMLVILANGGVMAASKTAERLAGLSVGAGFHNTAVQAHPHLLWLGDIIPVPGPLPNVLSVGDCLIFAGMLVLLHRSCHSQVTQERQLPRAQVGTEPVGS
jgi:hypothetical protein